MGVRLNAPRRRELRLFGAGSSRCLTASMVVYVRQKAGPVGTRSLRDAAPASVLYADTALGLLAAVLDCDNFLVICTSNQFYQILLNFSLSAAFGGVLLALIEGAGIMLNRFLSNPQNFPPMDDPAMVVPPNVAMRGVEHVRTPAGYPDQAPISSTVEESSGSSWFGGFFGGKKKDDTKSSDGKSEVLESFDVPSTPVPKFEYN
ncbi:uncharacterized protein A4U43_C06F14220 [Asparagus officinalis]|uniref:Uncharacterized protein n=1 Tax=Asparagus officinalis TaxID=4686 RepID=A0A5P1ESF0_ASPOF|nr:uncharacterized protein A4U43_C06F14220 [Asparagus officinalis]